METKTFLKSLGIMGPLLSAVAMGANTWFGGGSVIVEASEPQAAVEHATQVYNGILGLVGIATGIIGRWRAKTTIRMLGAAP